MRRNIRRTGLTFCILLAPACAAETTYDHESMTRPPPAPRPVMPDDPKEHPQEPIPNSFCDASAEGTIDFDLPVWDLYVDLKDWDRLHEDIFADVQVDAVICIQGEEHRIGLELQGASSRKQNKKSFDLKFDRGRLLRHAPFGEHTEPEGVDRIIMKSMATDQSLIRESVAFDMWRLMGHAAPHHGVANLRINGKYWGLYNLVEPVDKDYLKRHGYPPGGTLYKAVRKHGSRADFEPGRNLKKAFENKTNEESPTWDDLVELVEILQETPLEEAAYYERIDPIFPLEQYYDRMVWVSLTQNGDATAQNFFLYNAPDHDHDFWHLIPWDSNSCLGSEWTDENAVRPPSKSLLVNGGNYFARRLVRVDGVRESYVSRFLSVMDDVLTVDAMEAIIFDHARLVAHDLSLDRDRWKRRIEPEEAFDVLYDFVDRRPAYLRESLDALVLGEDDMVEEDDDESSSEDEDVDFDEDDG